MFINDCFNSADEGYELTNNNQYNIFIFNDITEKWDWYKDVYGYHFMIDEISRLREENEAVKVLLEGKVVRFF